MKKIAASALATAMLVGCATNQGYGSQWQPVVDLKPGQTQYYTDLGDCQRLSSQVMSAGQSAAAGAVAGALFGALLGAAAGGNSRFNGQMAGVGALTGGASAAGAAEGGQRGIISRCLAGRGYSVLN
jgi:outer membrane lipoprotein SlyB